MAAATHSPDRSLRVSQADALRYDAFSDEPGEVLALLLDAIPPGARVLDIGCGTGVLTKEIQVRRQAHVTGIEPDPARADIARQRGLDVHTGTFTPDLARRLGAYDVIVLADVLEHIAEPDGLLTVLNCALAAGGVVLASVPNVAHWTIRMRLLRGSFDYTPTGLMDETHLRWYTRSSLVRLFERNALAVEDVRPTVGSWLDIYDSRPFRILPVRLRRALIRRLVASAPTWGACQFVVTARPATR